MQGKSVRRGVNADFILSHQSETIIIIGNGKLIYRPFEAARPLPIGSYVRNDLPCDV